MDKSISIQARLIKSQINILNVTPLNYAQYGDGSIDGDWKFKGYEVQYLAIYYEFPYRVKGERYWSKQVCIARLTMDGLLDEAYEDICNHVSLLRAELED